MLQNLPCCTRIERKGAKKMKIDFGNNTLLSTKLKIPTPRKNYIVRRELFQQLDTAAEMSVIFIQGGAGTGKTTLVSSFLRERKIATVGWLSMDSGIDNLYCFWLYLATALSPFLEDGEHFVDFIKKSPDVRSIEHLIIMLINHIPSNKDYYLVLDDVHSMTDPELISSFEIFLQAMPENLHLFMLSREEPPVYLGPLAMSGRLLFIGSGQMYLSKEEGLDFLKYTLAVQEDAQQLIKLNQYAEGWIGGLQLVVAAKSMGGHSRELLKAGGGIAAAYLNRELFEKLDDAEKDFLVRTGEFSYFNYGICSVLFPDISHTAFQEIMETLIGKNLFIIVLDEQLEIYRYHNIFSEFLRQLFHRLPEETGKEYRSRVAAYLEEQPDYEEALQLYERNKDYSSMLRVVDSCDNCFELIPYLDKIPVDSLVEHAELSALCFLYDIWKMNDLGRSRELYTKFKEKYEDTALFHLLSFAEIYVSQDKRKLLKFKALPYEQIEKMNLNTTGKAFILIENSTALMEKMEYEEAEKCIRLALAIIGESNPYVNFFAYNQLAQVYEEMGRLGDSLDCYMQNENQIRTTSGMLGMESNYYFGILGVYMRRMELSKAKETISVCENIVQQKKITLEVALVTLLYHKAEMLFLTGEDTKGKEEVENMITAYSKYSILTMSRLLYELVCLELISEELTELTLKEIHLERDFARQPFIKLLEARLLYWKGEVNNAAAKIEEVLIFARKSNNILRLVEAGIAKIYMLVNTKKAESYNREMQNLVLEVIHYSYKNRILLPIYLDRKTLLPLLSRLLNDIAHNPRLVNAAELSFLRDAVQICENRQFETTQKPLLTVREAEIMKELALGITNKEISEKLCISQATVKTHVLSIYGKLGVSSRLKAVEAARENKII